MRNLIKLLTIKLTQMNTMRNSFGGRYESPELTVVELHLEGAVLQTSNWPTTGGGGISDLVDNGDEL